MTHFHTLRALLLTAALSGCAPAFAQQVPLVADFPMEKAGDTSPDNGPLNLFDQSRGGLFDGQGAQVTFSPFVGEYQALNFVGEGVVLQDLAAQVTQ